MRRSRAHAERRRCRWRSTAGPGTEDDNPALLHVPLGAPRDVGLGDLRHRDRRLHARGGSGLLEEILERQSVHHRAEHPHVVGAAAIHAALTQLGSAEEVPPADDDGDLHPVHRLGDLTGDLRHDVGVDPERPAAESLARQLQQNAPASGRFIDHVIPLVAYNLSKGMRKGPHHRSGAGLLQRQAPTLNRAKPVRVRPASAATLATDCLLSLA